MLNCDVASLIFLFKGKVVVLGCFFFLFCNGLVFSKIKDRCRLVGQCWQLFLKGNLLWITIDWSKDDADDDGWGRGPFCFAVSSDLCIGVNPWCIYLPRGFLSSTDCTRPIFFHWVEGGDINHFDSPFSACSLLMPCNSPFPLFPSVLHLPACPPWLHILTIDWFHFISFQLCYHVQVNEHTNRTHSRAAFTEENLAFRSASSVNIPQEPID